MKRLALAALLLAASASAQAQLYKCVDAQGRVSYSDKARAGCEATRIRGAKPPAPKAAPAAAKSAPPASKAGKAATGPAARLQSEAPPPAERSDAQQALHCRGLRQERAWLAGPRGEGVPARDERLGQLEQALRDCP